MKPELNYDEHFLTAVGAHLGLANAAKFQLPPLMCFAASAFLKRDRLPCGPQCRDWAVGDRSSNFLLDLELLEAGN